MKVAVQHLIKRWISPRLHTRIRLRRAHEPWSNLPPELLLIIFRYLLADSYPEVLQYECYFPYFGSPFQYLNYQAIDHGLLALLRAIRVCRAWRSIGDEVLYDRPFLFSRRQLALFARTVRKSPGLAALVHSITFMDGEEPEDLKSLLPIWPRRRRLDDPTRENAINVLSSCPSLRSLTIGFRMTRSTTGIPVGTPFLREALNGTHLRVLTLKGSLPSFTPRSAPPQFLTPDIDLPSLEILNLEQVHLMESLELPFLPSLRVLRILQSGPFGAFAEGGISSIQLPEELLPKLDTLELYQNMFHLLVPNHVLRRLKRFHHIGWHESIHFPAWINHPYAFPHLHHIAFGIFWSSQGGEPIGINTKFSALPVNVHAATIVLRHGVSSRSLLYPEWSVDTDLLRSVTRCVRDPQGSCCLQKLTLIFMGSYIHDISDERSWTLVSCPDLQAKMEEMEALTEDVRQACLARGIVYRELQNPEFDDWVTERVQANDLA
ncbi:unnamed protein product [Somion occarium]|uniref:F-box domain-containing protein n=1 Tax=Somion occarium TaxID=3059160 RepID=A0ABP1DQW4_9APHY